MKQKFYIIMAIFICHFSNSQEIFFKAGKNYTTYNYKNSFGESMVGLYGSDGSNFELGYAFILGDEDSSLESKYSYNVSLILNQFNARGGNVNNTYNWKTNYLGLQNVFLVSLIRSSDAIFNLKFKGGLNISTIVSGQQYIDNVSYDLTKHKEFKGIILQPLIGAEFLLDITRNITFNFSYSSSEAFNVSNNTKEKLSFITNQIQLGLQYTIY